MFLAIAALSKVSARAKSGWLVTYVMMEMFAVMRTHAHNMLSGFHSMPKLMTNCAMYK